MPAQRGFAMFAMKDTDFEFLKPLKVGGLTLATNMILSPMSGVTDSAFRRLVLGCSGSSVGLLVSEFIAAEGLTRDNPKTRAMLHFEEDERPVSIQIFGADVDRMVRAARMVEECGADIVDVNCGCPAPKVVRRGGGAELMRTPERLLRILEGITAAVSIPVTVKIRSGWDDASINALDIARLVQDQGAAMLAVHGRSRVQLYRGEADWDLVARIKEELDIPVIGSGDLRTPEQILHRISAGYADGVMVGRAAIDNPWIFAQTQDLAQGRRPRVISESERIEALRLFRRGLEARAVERAFLGRYRGLACRFVKGRPGGSATRRALGTARTADDVQRIFEDFISGNHSGLDLLQQGLQAATTTPDEVQSSDAGRAA